MASKRVGTLIIIEDDKFTSNMLKRYFEAKGWLVHQALDVASAYSKAVSYTFDGAILDVSFPSGSSLDAFEGLKKVLNCPVLVYTSTKKESIELLSFKIGADDFLMKDRGVNVLYIRLLKLIGDRKASSVKSTNVVKLHNVMIDRGSNTVKVQGGDTIVHLTNNEMALLFYLSVNVGEVLSRDELSYVLNGCTFDGCSRRIDLLIFRMRKKLKDAFGDELNIETIRSKGYRLTG
ncbi:TPA: response regulator transcription factor [Vibrio parahaemolyticus]